MLMLIPSATNFEHPTFVESIQLIREQLGATGLNPLQQRVLECLIHSSGDFNLTSLLYFSTGACEQGINALRNGAAILTDTMMAAAAVTPTAARCGGNKVYSVLEWAPALAPVGSTRTVAGMTQAWAKLANNQIEPKPVLLVGSSPTVLEWLLNNLEAGAVAEPALVIGMPVGFIRVAESKRRLAVSRLPQIRLEGSRGGAGLAAAAVNALLRASVTDA
ncbi:precorrin-8X methylmutase [cyanobiont of Ornithocercus magnificus]|nr:precorrin-8X methylmutase [cyanobiont of Ornithocercus magnificus]